MHHLPTLITDLALITVYAGLVTLLFKWLKQPVVLGYVLAGIFAGPFIHGLPSVTDKENIQIWADIGVIFLLFSLGLEFSFKKIVNVGKAAIITASANVIFMLFTGYLTGQMLGWTTIDSLFLGGMISMSSTTIIIKAFDELGMKKMRFTDLVFGVLVVEDLVAILLLVLLPTVAISQSVDGTQLLVSTSKLIFFLVFCFIIGIFTVPTFIKKAINYMNDEMLLLTSIALCLGMVVLSTSAGFSSALGAFIMGSILAESSTVHRIENLLKPVKNFFGAVFFVSVGMMVNPMMFLEYAGPIMVITCVVMIGMILFSCIGFTLSGQPLRTSILCSFSLAQVGEFAFIIASLGMSLGVLSNFVYPIIVAVSVVTTFTTPLMIKSADKFYYKLNKKLPEKLKVFLDNITSSKPDTKAEQNMWKKLFKSYFLRLFVFSIIIIGIINISTFLCKPWLTTAMPDWDNRLIRVVSTAITLMVLAPFLHALLISKEKTLSLYFDLWMEKKANRIPLIFLTAIRILLVIFFIMMTTHQLLTTNPYITGLLVLSTIFALAKSKWVLNQYMRIETQFLVNLNREQLENFKNTQEDDLISDEDKWLDSSVFVCQFEIEKTSELAGKLMRETFFQEIYAINVIKIIRDKSVINVPRGCDELKAQDNLLIVGTKKQLRHIANELKDKGLTQTVIGNSSDKIISLHDYILTQNKYEFKNDKTLLCCAIPVTKDSSLNDNTLRASLIRTKTDNCLVVGVERKSSLTLNPKVTFIFKEGDLLWLLGEQKTISQEVFRQTPIVSALQENE